LTDRHREIYEDQSIGGEHPENYFDKHLAAVGPDQLWVAVQNEQIVGLVGLILKEEEAEVEPLIISRMYRGRGIGKRLLGKAVAEARAREVRLLAVRPVARNIETIQFLHKQGFTNIGFIELFMDLSKRSWKPGPQMFGCEFKL
jgi:N-acetylglutamate synthase-like GNAT family acetyltransferase